MSTKRFPWALALVALLAALVVSVQALPLTNQQIILLNNSSPAARQVGLGTKLSQALTTNTSALAITDAGGKYTTDTVEAALAQAATYRDGTHITLTDAGGYFTTDTVEAALAQLAGKVDVRSLFWYGATGHDAGSASDGVLYGTLTPQAVTSCQLQTHAMNTLNGTGTTLYCSAVTGGTAYTTDTADANNATTNDITLVAATGAVNDCVYIGNTSYQFARADIVSSTTGNFVGVVAWEYWNGAWTAIPAVTDGTTALSAAGTNSVTYAIPAGWVTCQVNSVTGYWIRGRITTATSGGGALGTKVYTVVSDTDSTFTDYTTAANSAGAGDVNLLPLYPVLNDAVYIGKTAKYCKIKATVSQAMTVGAGVITPEYSKAGSAWATLTCDDNTTTWKAGTSTYWISFVPPSDWASVTINSVAGYYIRFRLSTAGVTQQPLGTQLWLDDGTHGTGIRMPNAGTLNYVQFTGQTAAGTTADPVFLFMDLTSGSFASATWTKTTTYLRAAVGSGITITAGDALAVVEVIEDGSSEPTNVNFILEVAHP